MTKEEKHRIKTAETVALHAFFREIWDEREDEDGYCYCYETGAPMHRNTFRNNSSVYDHVLEKREGCFPQYKFTKKNILIVLPKVHSQKTTDIDKTPKMKAYRDKLLILHEKNQL